MSASYWPTRSRIGACACGHAVGLHLDRTTNRFVGCDAAKRNQLPNLHDRLSAALQSRTVKRIVSAFPSSSARS